MSDLEQLAQQAVSHSRADVCFVLVEEDSRTDVRWANDDLHLNAAARTRQVTVQSFIRCERGYRLGLVTQPWDSNWERAVAEADALAPLGPVFDEEPNHYPPESDDTATYAIEEPAEPLVREVFGALANSGATSFTGYATSQNRVRGLASSAGWSTSAHQARSHCELQGRRADSSAWAAGVASAPWGIDVMALRQEVEHRLGWGQRRIHLPPGRYQTLLEPACVADLMLHLYWSAGVGTAHVGKSPFGRAETGVRLGEQLAQATVSLRSDPFDVRAPVPAVVAHHGSGSERSVFDNGVRLRPMHWISHGRLVNVLGSRSSAQAAGVPFAPRVDNLILEDDNGAGTTAELLTQIEEGLLVTSLWYTRDVDPATLGVTGLTRDGVYYVRDGEIVGQAGNFRFNDSSLSVLSRILSAGASERAFAREGGLEGVDTVVPPLAVSDFNLTAATNAI